MTDQRLPHRLRLLQGLAEVLSGKEYAAVTVSDIVAAAGVSKRTFYEHFESKQECLLACYAEANGLLVAGLRSQGAGGAAHGAQRLTGLIDAYLGFLDESRATAAALLVEITSAGAEGRRVRRETNLELARVMLEVSNRPPDDPFDLDQALALVGGVTELVLTHAENHPDRPFREVRPAVLKFVGSVLRPATLTVPAEPAGAGA